MTDASFQLLSPSLHDGSLRTLCIADENLLTSAAGLSAQPQLSVISNRYDVYSACANNGLQASFSDYDCSALADASIDQVVYRVSKEKPVVHHVINAAFRVLKSGGQLLLAGEKGDGIKTYVDKAAKLFGHKSTAQKQGNSYLARITKAEPYSAARLLDDRDYQRVRTIAHLNGKAVASKPGLFGWDKIDAGSEFLLQVAEDYLSRRGLEPGSILDLGCGYGYLTLGTAAWPRVHERFASDNNAAAVRCMQLNADSFGLTVQVSADDCGAHINKQFDLVICNPPFHQGFSVDASLTKKFLRNSWLRLNSSGTALFVVNQFIGLERLASQQFAQVKTLASNGKFKVLALRP